jgi:large subunit ribosomal protein L4
MPLTSSLPILDSQGAEVGSVELKSHWLTNKGEQAVHDTVVAFLAGIRAGTASTKNRSQVRGGGTKPYRQKGTGRARAGSIRSPLWRGGGVIFGPHPRSFAKQVNRKVRRLALRRAFSDRVREGAVIVVQDIKVAQPRTREMVALLRALDAGEDVLVLVPAPEEDLYLSARNLPGVEVMTVEAVNAYWLLLFKKIVVSAAALELLGNRLAPLPKEDAE